MAPEFVEQLHENLSADLAQIAARFKNPKITLIVRSPDLADGDVVLTDDDLESAIASIRKLQKNATHVVEPKPVVRKGCNRHVDCTVSEAAYMEKNGRHPGFNFHCHDDCCEDCFGQ